MEELKCPICGESTRVYMGNARKDKLCGKHADMLKKGDIIVNEEGLFVDAKTNKILNSDYKQDKDNEQPKKFVYHKQYKKDDYDDKKTDKSLKSADNQKEENEHIGRVRCIACGKEVEPGFLFCKSCYAQYVNKELLVKISKCREVEILDESYEGHYTCDDGHIVKSKSERDIDNYLFENGIPHAYERAYIPTSDPTITLKPDFTLPNFNGSGKDVIIEHWGFNENNLEYKKSKNYKMKIYKKEKVTIISTNEKDIQDYKVSLRRKLATFEYDKINFDE